MPLTPTQVSGITLGPLSQAVKKRASKAQWRKIVKDAHAKGYQVESYLDSSVPDAMKARTKKSLAAEATKTITAAYAPAEKEIGDQEVKVKAIDDKRARDNQYYLQWLNSKSNELNAHRTAANDKLRDMATSIADSTAQAVGALRQGIAQSVTETPGVISDPNQSNVLNGQVVAGGEAVQGQANAAAIQTGQQIENQNATQAGYDSSNFAFIAANEARRAGDTWSKLSELADEKGKLQLTKAADTAKEIARLLDTERDKANANEQNRIVAERLGVDRAELSAKINQDAITNALNQGKLDETIRSNKEREALRRTQNSIANGFRQAEIDIQQGNLDLGWYKAKHPNTGSKSGGAGGKGAKSKDPQTRFDYGYALVATSRTPGTPGSGNKPGKPGKTYSPEYVQKNLKLVENQLVANGLSRKMAQAVLAAFMSNGRDRNKDPGNYTDWVKGAADNRPT